MVQDTRLINIFYHSKWTIWSDMSVVGYCVVGGGGGVLCESFPEQLWLHCTVYCVWLVAGEPAQWVSQQQSVRLVWGQLSEGNNIHKMLPKNFSLKKLFVIFSFFEIFCTRVGNSERFSQGMSLVTFYCFLPIHFIISCTHVNIKSN